MRIKKGDLVKVIAGDKRWKGQTGRVLQVFSKQQRLRIEGVRPIKRHLKPQKNPLHPEGGISALDAPGQPFHAPAADAALFTALEATVNQTATRQLIRVPHNINDPAFAVLIVETFRALNASPRARSAGG